MIAAVLSLLFISQFQAVSSYTDEALMDQIKALPGAELLNLPFNQFSGYLTIPGKAGLKTKHMHYWFTESVKSPATDPVAFWTNGGPGCSGLIGFMTEQGPFRPNADMTLSYNEYGWNQVANTVFIESPAGVGYSYSDDKADYTTGDEQTAIDNYNLIQAFMQRFPEYQSNSLYITSESYGGHYMPTLAKKIVDENALGVNAKLNFKGFAVGNPYTDPYSGTPAMIDTFWGHQLVAKPTWDSYQAACAGTTTASRAQCLKLELQINNGIGNLNAYALDYPVCTSDSVAKKGRAQRLWLLKSFIPKEMNEKERRLLEVPLADEYEPCADDYASSYLNLASVKEALHVRSNMTWNDCSNIVNYNSTDSTVVSTAPIYNYLIDGGFGLDILVYSGDDDSVCATIGTQEWIWGLGYPVASQWQVYTYNGQTAGYSTKWAGTKLGFLTIHGAGHEVPTYKPDVALDMFTRYLNGEFTNA